MEQLNRARIIGWVGGKPVREIRGGSGQVFEQGGTGGQQQGGDGGGQADPDLIGGTAGGDPAGGQGGQGGTGQQGAPEGEQPPAWWAAASAAQTAAMNSEIDRRINQLQNRRGGGQQGGQQQQGGQGGDGGQGGEQPRGIDQRDLRDARAEFRDVLRDVQLTQGERDFVNQISPGVVTAALSRTGDPFDAGAEAARTVQAGINQLRSSHQAEMMARLRQLGAINEDRLRPGATQQSTTGRGAYVPGKATVGEQFSGGVSRAQDAAARRGLATPGSVQPGQNQQ